MTDPVIDPRRAEDDARLKALRDAVQVGIDDLNNGPYKSFDSPIDLENYLHELAARALA